MNASRGKRRWTLEGEEARALNRTASEDKVQHLSKMLWIIQTSTEGINHRVAIVGASWQKWSERSIWICGKKIIFGTPASLGSGTGVFTYKTLA